MRDYYEELVGSRDRFAKFTQRVSALAERLVKSNLPITSKNLAAVAKTLGLAEGRCPTREEVFLLEKELDEFENPDAYLAQNDLVAKLKK